ncbi:MAG: energy transducer TonB [Acidobacteriota bacterium]|nr:energy transducer TonB [Acidobacteriota bacterium]
MEPPAPLVRLGDLDYPLRLLEAPKPELTPEAREAEVQGRVFLSVLVDPNGNVKDARIMIEPGYGLGRAAAEAVKHWRYSPPRNKGRRARVWKTEVVEFQLPQ